MKSPFSLLISKSEYMLFLKHPAWLWLKKHDKKKLPIITDNLQAKFDAGFEFETYAEKLFSNAKRVGFSNYDEYLSQPTRTLKAIEEGNKTIFQGRFESGNITCICDVVIFKDTKTLDLIEIKSSTQAKIEHEYDLAFQLEVLEACGYEVDSIKVVCVNNEYVRNGDIDITLLTKEVDVTDRVEAKREETKLNIKNALKVVLSPTIPNISPISCVPNALSEWLEIYRTLVTVPEYSIYDLCRQNLEIITVLEKNNIKLLRDIPDNIELHPKQANQVKVVKENKIIIDKKKISDFLAKFVYPLYFLDYETLASAIPVFDGLRPYQQVPFQYSLHVIEKPGQEPKHFGYIHNQNTNPILPLSEALKSQIGEHGTILVWNQSFEKGKNAEMGIHLNEYFDFYEKINNRIVDLMLPFSNDWYIHKDFFGSASIKKVLPVLVPELSYKALEINEGGSAQRIWMETILMGKYEADRKQIFSDLDKYCELDTLAMVKIYQKLIADCGSIIQPCLL